MGIVSGCNFFTLKGIVETLCGRMGIHDRLEVTPIDGEGFQKGTLVELSIGKTKLGYLGMLGEKQLKAWKLPDAVATAEISLPTLLSLAGLVPQQQSVSTFPSIQRDLNFVVAESVRWNQMEDVVRAAVGSELAGVRYQETYRDEKKDGKDRKRVLMTVQLQRHDSTLSGDQADELVGKVINACRENLAAELLS